MRVVWDGKGWCGMVVALSDSHHMMFSGVG